MKNFHLHFIFPVLLPVLTPALSQTQVTIGSSKDNTLYESSTGSLSNGAGQHFFTGRTNQVTGSLRRGLIAFDVGGNIPQGATILNVTLTLSMSQTSSGNQMVTLHRVLTFWGEGTSVALGNEGSGAPATVGDATWLYAVFDSLPFPWNNPGGDFSQSPSATQTVGVIGTYTWGSTPAMVSDVQQWLDNPSVNFGWLLLGNEITPLTAKRFDTKENLTAAFRPQLIVVFQPPVSVQPYGHMPTEFALYQNYPNPFNPSTTIRFEVPVSGVVSMNVYNLLGQEVATLVNKVKEAGRHEVVWDAQGMPGGVFFYRLQTKDFASAKKLLLIR